MLEVFIRLAGWLVEREIRGGSFVSSRIDLRSGRRLGLLTPLTRSAFWNFGVPDRKHRPLSYQRSLTNALDALWLCLLLVEDGCSQLESEIRLRRFDDATHVAQQTVKLLFGGAKAYRRITAGLQDMNASDPVLIFIKNQMNAARIMMIALLKRARAEEIEPETRQLMDDLQVIMNTSGVCL